MLEAHSASAFELEYGSWRGASHMALVVEKLPGNVRDVRDMGSIPGSGRSPGGGHGNPLQHSCLENPMARGATVYMVVKESDMTKAT